MCSGSSHDTWHSPRRLPAPSPGMDLKSKTRPALHPQPQVCTGGDDSETMSGEQAEQGHPAGLPATASVHPSACLAGRGVLGVRSRAIPPTTGSWGLLCPQPALRTLQSPRWFLGFANTDHTRVLSKEQTLLTCSSGDPQARVKVWAGPGCRRRLREGSFLPPPASGPHPLPHSGSPPPISASPCVSVSTWLPPSKDTVMGGGDQPTPAWPRRN